MPYLQRVTGDASRVPEFTDVTNWSREAYRILTPPGWTNLPEVSTMKTTCPLVLRYRGGLVPTLPLQSMIFWEKLTPEDIQVVLGSHIAFGERLRVPIDETGRMRIHLGAPHARATYDNLVLTRNQMDEKQAPELAPDAFREKLLLLARTDAAVKTVDLGGGRKACPGELFAAAIATMQSRAFPQNIGIWFDFTLIALVAIGCLWLPRWRIGRTALWALAGLVIYFGIALLVFRQSLLTLPGVLPVGLAFWVVLLRVGMAKRLRIIAF
jgi:hypothetical protein